MSISKGDTLPAASFMRIGADGPEAVALSEIADGKRIVIFAVPGAYTRTCTAAHVPSFIRTKDAYAEKGITDIYCLSVNDPFVMDAWGQSTGANAAGIQMLADPEGTFTKAIGMEFSAPPVGLIGRSLRYAMIVENGTVQVLHVEEGPGVCDLTAGETLLAEV